MKSILLQLSFILSSFHVQAQIDTMALKTPEGVCAKMLEFISFEKNEIKNWEEYRNLFLPGAQKMSFRFLDGESLAKQVKRMNIEEFIRYWGPGYSKTGFEEYVIGIEVKEFNGIASVFQSFYCKTLDGSYEARGVNSYQVVFLNDEGMIYDHHLLLYTALFLFFHNFKCFGRAINCSNYKIYTCWII